LELRRNSLCEEGRIVYLAEKLTNAKFLRQQRTWCPGLTAQPVGLECGGQGGEWDAGEVEKQYGTGSYKD